MKQQQAKQFIELVESKQLLSPEIVDELHKQVAESKTRLTPELLAKLLVDNGHLTKFQATKLIAELKEQTADASQNAEGFAAEADEPEEEELGFAPEPETAEDEPAPASEDQNIAPVFADEAQPQIAQVVEVEPVEVVEAVSAHEPGQVVEAVEVVDVVEALPPASPVPFAADDESGFDSSPPAMKKPVRPNQPTSNPWDSFRILGVGLILALVLVAGYYLLNWFIRGNAEDRLARANDAYESRSYETAASMYTEFAEDFPTSEEVSFARVRSALSNLRNRSEGAPDPEIGLDVALEVLPAVAEEPSLAEQRAEIAGVLTALAGKFNERADATEKIEERKHLMSRMDQLLELTNDPRFVGANERNQQAPTLLRIQEDRQRILREINRDEELAATLIEFDNMLAEKDPLAAYRVRKKLIRRYPLLEANESLRERVKQASQLQQTLVKQGSLRPKLSSTDPGEQSRPSFVLGNRSGQPASKLRGQVAFVRVKGSIYGLDAATGDILWRKSVGLDFSSTLR